MSSTADESPLIEALMGMPANAVYRDANRRAIFDAFRLYKDRAVRKIVRGEGGERITVLVQDAEIHTVTLSLRGAVLQLSCAGHIRPLTERCPHIVCALLTLVHLLRPNLFRMGDEDNLYRQELLKGLLRQDASPPMRKRPGTAKAAASTNLSTYPQTAAGATSFADKSSYALILEDVAGTLFVHVERIGKEGRFSSDKSPLPPPVQALNSPIYYEDRHGPLRRFLKRHGRDYALLFRKGGTTSQLTWVARYPLRLSTELAAEGEEIVVRKKCVLDTAEREAHILSDFIFDLEEKHLFLANNKKGWRMWESLRQAMVDNGPLPAPAADLGDSPSFRLPKRLFNELLFSISGNRKEDLLDSVIFTVEGTKTPIAATPPPHYALSIRQSDRMAGYFLARPECRVEDYAFSPRRRVAAFIRSLNANVVPGVLHAKKRRTMLFEAFFQVVAAPSKEYADGILTKAINESTFGSSTGARWGRSLVMAQADGWKENEFQVCLLNDCWRLLPLDRAREMALYTALFHVFGQGLFEGIACGDERTAVHESELFSFLHDLRQSLGEHDIELRLGDKPVEAVTWDFELDASNSSIDWFEIRPEIRCRGRAVSEEVWQRALARRGIIYSDGSLQILDEASLRTLAAILDIKGRAQKGRKEIVALPRLRIFEVFSLRRQGVTVLLSPEDEHILACLTRLEGVERMPAPKGLRTELRGYQKDGYSWLSFLFRNRFGACLADDMGLGKTIQALSLLAAIKEGSLAGGPEVPLFLIVVPPSLLFNWEREIERFYPGFKVYLYRGQKRSTDVEGFDIVLTSYALVHRDIERLKEIFFTVIIFDEAQTVKNISAGTTGAARQLKCRFKVALTGTPMENHVGEYFSIIDLVVPGLLGDYSDFQRHARQDLSSLLPVVTERTRPFVLRRTKQAILKELPPKVENDVYLELTERQKKFYTRMVQEARSTIGHAYDGKRDAQARIIALTAIMRLRQICLTPRLLAPELKEPSPKIDFLKEKLAELSNESHSCLVFSQFTSFLDIVEAELGSNGSHLFRLDGTTPVRKRKEIVEAFQEGAEPSVFLLSLKAGGQGLNLTKATYVFHLDPWWNPAVENQASDRTHRIGQKNKVIVTRLLMRHTVEEKMMELKRKKLAIYRALMASPETVTGKAISREDFEFLLSP
jgi:superfamily II DNA or RNA helicase